MKKVGKSNRILKLIVSLFAFLLILYIGLLAYYESNLKLSLLSSCKLQFKVKVYVDDELIHNDSIPESMKDGMLIHSTTYFKTLLPGYKEIRVVTEKETVVYNVFVFFPKTTVIGLYENCRISTSTYFGRIYYF